MASHPLDGARFKIVWAQEHLNCLKTEIGVYLDKQADEVRSQPHMRPEHTWLGPTHILPRIVASEPDLCLSAIIGDCITNARAALDYVMWELAQRYFAPALDVDNFEDKRMTTFPIFDDPFPPKVKARFDGLANRKIPADAIKEIKAVQPYNAGHGPLGWLNQLVNRDKHRMLLLTRGEPNHLAIEFAPSPLFPKGETVSIAGNDLAAIGHPPFQSDMQMKGKATFHVTWKDAPVPHVAVDWMLEQIIKSVADIIPRFDPFF